VSDKLLTEHELDEALNAMQMYGLQWEHNKTHCDLTGNWATWSCKSDFAGQLAATIRALRTERDAAIATLRLEQQHRQDEWQALHRMLGEVKTERDRLAKDARRYRYLRGTYGVTLGNGQMELRIVSGPRGLGPEGIDATIDAALKSEAL
jgi:hypothetical protein